MGSTPLNPTKLLSVRKSCSSPPSQRTSGLDLGEVEWAKDIRALMSGQIFAGRGIGLESDAQLGLHHLSIPRQLSPSWPLPVNLVRPMR